MVLLLEGSRPCLLHAAPGDLSGCGQLEYTFVEATWQTDWPKAETGVQWRSPPSSQKEQAL